MSLNFPSSPAVNDVYVLGTRTWRFNGNGWAVVSPQGELGFTGSVGFVGSTGNRGGLRYYYDSTITAGITANGSLRFNNATFNSITLGYINDLDIGGANLAAFIGQWADSTNPIKGQLRVQPASSFFTSNAVFNITAVTDNTTFYTLTLSPVPGGTLPAAGEALAIEFIRAGNQGFAGSAGAFAALGYTGSAFLGGQAISFTNITVTSTREQTVTTAGPVSGVVAIDYILGTVVIYNSISGALTANFTNVPTDNENIIVFVITVLQGATAFSVSAVQIAGAAQTIRWADGIIPTGNANSTDVFTFALYRTSAGAWAVTGHLNSYR